MGRRRTLEEFKEQASQRYNNFFDYSLITEYKCDRDIIEIICPNHGVIKSTPDRHLSSSVGCKYCGIEKRNVHKKSNTEEFIEKAIKVHGDSYLYENTKYVRANQKLTITCKHHGDYLQTSNAHLAGKGCEKCAIIYNAFVREDYVKKAKGRDTIIYILKCWNSEEQFYKIGKTFETIKKRYSYGKLSYDYEVLDFKISDASTIHVLEVELHKKYGMYRYSPKITFGGHTERYKASLSLINVLEL